MKVLIIAEDPRLDQYMLKPIVAAALAFAGKPTARVVVCQDARQRGDTTVIGKESIVRLTDDYPLYDVYILCVDRDCRAERPASLKALQDQVSAELANKKFIAICGIEELEVWVLAGMKNLRDAWADVRAHCNPKEAFFDPYALMRRVEDTPGRGRKVLGEEAAEQYANRIRNMCTEVRMCETAE